METIAGWMDRVLRAPADAGVAATVGAEVCTLCARRPIYPDYRA